MGRPTSFTAALGDIICELIAGGVSLRVGNELYDGSMKSTLNTPMS